MEAKTGGKALWVALDAINNRSTLAVVAHGEAGNAMFLDCNSAFVEDGHIIGDGDLRRTS